MTKQNCITNQKDTSQQVTYVLEKKDSAEPAKNVRITIKGFESGGGFAFTPNTILIETGSPYVQTDNSKVYLPNYFITPGAPIRNLDINAFAKQNKYGVTRQQGSITDVTYTS